MVYGKSQFTQVESDGSFEIENVHQNSYDLFVFKPGMIGELRQNDIEITKGKATDIGQLVLKPHDKGEVLWQIGIPDGMAMEFKNGRNYHQWDNTERYAWDFPDDVHYVVGESDWKTDWNYMQPVTSRGKWTPTTWTIDFDLEKVPAGKAVLMMVCAGAEADLDVIVNGNKVGDLKVSLGGQHGRSAPTGEIAQKEFEIESNYLKPGKNQIQLTFAKGLATDPKAAERKIKKWLSPFIVYDFVRLEIR